MKQLVTTPKSKFLFVVCKKCKNEQIIFSKAASVVKCLSCGEELAVPTGGKAQVKVKVLEKLG